MFRIKLILGVLLGASSVSHGQDVNMGDVGYLESNPAPCNTFGVAANNFFDDGVAGNYSADFNDTTVFCPDLTLGTKMTATFGINAGFEFDVDGSDSIYVYDGPNTSSPLIGVHNSITDPTGFAHTASWSNPSGCLTFVFISDGAVEGTGWNANVSCGNQNQPFEPHIEAFVNGSAVNSLNPIDTGYVDICLGDSILFIAKPLFPNSLENLGSGYSQTVDVVDYDWNITDGNTYPNNDSVWFKPLTRSGFLVDLKITDAFPQIERIICKVRVAQLPSFELTGPLEDSVCLGESTTLLGGVTNSDTVGVDIPGGTFQLGGSFAGLTYLPDGSGAQYEAPITIGGFPSGSVINSSQDLNQVCITMEHSFIGDLEIALECPNGTQVSLLNSYDPGFIPGGVGGGSTYMGDPIDDSGGGGPGEGWEYCFSSVFNTWGDWPSQTGNTIPAPNFGNNGPSLNPNGVYLPEDDFANFIGCPVNGQWTIVVQDNQGIDDGYIFEWGLFFDASYFPDAAGYQNTIVTSAWLDDPTIVSGQSDTALVVIPTETGFTDYTFIVEDDYGCFYDTTVVLFVMPLPTIFSDTLVCSYEMIALNTTSFSGGVWSSDDPEIQFSNPQSENPLISSDTIPGVYVVTYTDNQCNTSVSSSIDFPEYPGSWMVDTVMCEGSVYNFEAVNDNIHDTQFLWSNGVTGENITFTEAGTYGLSMTNICYVATDSISFEFKRCDIEAPNVISLAQGSQNPLWYLDAEGLSEITIVITNRWGNVVYECSDSVELCKWDGTNRKGNSVDEGVYFYRVDAITEAKNEIQKHGFIHVVR